MKKFLLILFTFFYFINSSVVFAVESQFKTGEKIEGIAYTKYDGNTRYYRNAMTIVNVDTGQVAYCIEPFNNIVDYSNYSGGTEYDSRFGISEDKWNRIKLYAYYGYGYYGHQDKKWVSITQLSIWRELHPEYEFNWIDDVKSRNVIYPFESELNELRNLVNSHNLKPTFKNEYVLSIDEELNLVDSNNVLQYYSIKYSDFDIDLNGNSLKVLSNSDEKEGTIILERPKSIYSDNVIFYYNESSQNVMQSGNLIPDDLIIKLKVEKGRVIVNKVDADTLDSSSQGEALIDGTKFYILDENKNIIEEKEIVNGSLEFIDLPFGKYFIKESLPGVGYELNEDLYEVIINEDNLSPTIEIKNNVIKSNVTITKYFGTRKQYDTNSMEKEQGVTFNIYDSKEQLVFTGVTDDEGVINTVLPYGKYTLRQIDTTSGYEKASDYEFVIDKDSNVSSNIILYDFKIEVPNAGINVFDWLFV